jgi:hypothetical protein
VEGAPAAVRGISIFIVPKIWVNPDGTLGQPNAAVCTGIEEKTASTAAPPAVIRTCVCSLQQPLPFKRLKGERFFKLVFSF